MNDHLPYEYLYYKDEIVMKLVFILNVLVLEILYCIAQDICLVFIFVFKKRHVKPLPFDKNTLRYVYLFHRVQKIKTQYIFEGQG